MVQPVDASALAPAPSFGARVIDTLNPLQHIPFVNFLYREITGDTITPEAQFAGGFLFGGPIGALSAAAGMIVSGLAGEVMPDKRSAFNEETPDKTPRAKFIDPWKFNA